MTWEALVGTKRVGGGRQVGGGRGRGMTHEPAWDSTGLALRLSWLLLNERPK